jgi:hypothetical protein
MIIKVYAWIPRSYVHIAEVIKKINDKKIDFDVSNVNYNDNITFVVNSFKKYKNLEFTLDGDGLYALSVKLPETNIDKEVSEFYAVAKIFILDHAIKNFHNVTYNQIIEGILPINYSTIILTSKEHEVKNYEVRKHNGVTIYLKPSDFYVNDSFIYLSGKFSKGINEVLDLTSFSIISSHFMYEMMNKMEAYHKGTKEVINLIEHEPGSELINNAYLNIDLVKKDASESLAKAEQAISCIERKNIEFETLTKNRLINELMQSLNTNENFKKLNADKEYILSLWTLLLNHLDNVDTAVKAQVNYKSSKANQCLGAINTCFILVAIIMSVFMVNIGLNGLYTLIVLIIAWVVAYELVSYLMLRRK